MDRFAVIAVSALTYTKHTGNNMESHNEIISRLKFLSSIEKDEKIDTRRVIKQPDNISTKMIRTFFYPESRSNTIKFISDIITRTHEIILLNQTDIEYCSSLVNDLINSNKGITNLRFTYSADAKFCSDLDVIVQGITRILNSLKNKIPELFKDGLKGDGLRGTVN
jgi:hypothetical protein